ncbi:hypothetical protein BJX63DRAFT_192725 [Aspergillus granulosus]|uniref:Uncharacterized protein n=1 Tax=Aspergillus granulosus TaxID=176169 RepID=A0ABR4GR68_9EURO
MSECKRSSSFGQTLRADDSPVSQPVVPACGTQRPSTRVQGISNDLQRMSRWLPQILQSCDRKSCRILIFLTWPAKHGVTRGKPRPIRSPALRLAVSGVAAVDSERQSLIQEAITAGGGWKIANQGNIERCLKLKELWSNAVHRRYAPSWLSGGLSPLEQHPLLTGFALPCLRTRISSICGRGGRRETGVGGNRREYLHDRRPHLEGSEC